MTPRRGTSPHRYQCIGSTTVGVESIHWSTTRKSKNLKSLEVSEASLTGLQGLPVSRPWQKVEEIYQYYPFDYTRYPAPAFAALRPEAQSKGFPMHPFAANQLFI